jgi:hypothetical protein
MKKLGILVWMSTAMLPGTALAMPTFPGQIQQHLGLSAAPGCIICHSSDAGGGPVSQPFGQAMLGAGLTIAGGNSLTTALDKLEADGTDSNGDGIPDITGLRQGVMPTGSKPPVEYGCGARIATSEPKGWQATVASALVLGFLLTRALRRRTEVTSSKESDRATRV